MVSTWNKKKKKKKNKRKTSKFVDVGNNNWNKRMEWIKRKEWRRKIKL